MDQVTLLTDFSPHLASNPSYPSPREGTSYSALSKTSSVNHFGPLSFSPVGEMQVTPNIDLSPHLTSPVGEGQIPLQVILSSVVV